MTRYWDSSALLDVLGDSRIEALSKEKDQWTRPHTLAEMYSTLTGSRLGFSYHPADAAAIIREITASMNFVELSPGEIQAALDSDGQKRGVRGGNVHDFLHAVAARKAKVETLLTDNLTDYANLADGFSVTPP